jgi:hypothetical protein
MEPDEEVALTSRIRHFCALCGVRKLAADYPASNQGIPILVTCNACLSNVSEHSQKSLLGELEASATCPKRKRESTGRSRPVKKAKKTREPPPSTAECRICAEVKHRDAFPKPTPNPKGFSGPPRNVLDIPSDCASHLCVRKANKSGPICKDCIGKSLAGSLSFKPADRLGCPDEKCGLSWGATEYILKYLSTEDFSIYCGKLFNTFVATNKHMHFCVNPECALAGIVDTLVSGNRGFPHMECFECKTRQCANCKSPWHKDQTCQQYQLAHGEKARSKEEKDSLKQLVKDGARRCTHCAMAILKIDGCPNMYCKQLLTRLAAF